MKIQVLTLGRGVSKKHIHPIFLKMLKDKIPFVLVKRKDWQQAKQQLLQLKNSTDEALGLIQKMEKGEVSEEDALLKNRENPLVEGLFQMREKLRQSAVLEQQRNWVVQGLAKFSDLLRIHNQDIKELSDQILTNLVKYLNANQGVVFLAQEDDAGRKYLEMSGCYAYERRRFLNMQIEPGEGLAGQVFLEKQTTLLKEVPENYIRITSGLGQSLPRNILIVPMKYNEEVVGIIEVASFRVFATHEIEFVEKLSESLASSILSVRVAEKTQRLLQVAQQQSEEMRAQEEEMRQNLEELEATQEEMRRKNNELETAHSKMAANEQVLRQAVEKMRAAQQETEAQKKMIEEKELQVQESMKSLEAFQKEMDGIQEEMQRRMEDLNRAQEELIAQQKELEVAKAKLSSNEEVMKAAFKRAKEKENEFKQREVEYLRRIEELEKRS